VHGASTFSITTFSILTLGLESLYESLEGLYVTLSIEGLYVTLSIEGIYVTLSIEGLNVTLSISDTQHNNDLP
jgi:hypothetical protein